MEHKRVITIKIDSNEEYRVPSPDGGEAGAYYTNNKTDAFSTAVYMYERAGISIDGIRIKKVVEHN